MLNLFEAICEVYPNDQDFLLELGAEDDYEFDTVFEGKTYVGPTTITPSRNSQILHTKETMLPSDIVINPIPSNYGLITYNGAILTVS